MHKKVSVWAIFALACSCMSNLFAATMTYTGAGDGKVKNQYWTNTLNWADEMLPGVDDSVTMGKSIFPQWAILEMGGSQQLDKFYIPDWASIKEVDFGSAADRANGYTFTAREFIRGDMNDNSYQTFPLDMPLFTNTLWRVYHGYGSGFAVSGIISGDWGMIKMANGTLRLNTTNTFTGPLEIVQGTVELNFGAGRNADILAPATVVSLQGGTYKIQGRNDGVCAQTNDLIVVAAGSSTIAHSSGNKNGYASFYFKEFGHEPGGLVNFAPLSANETMSDRNGYLLESIGDGSGILGAYATFNSTSWAYADQGMIKAYSDYTPLTEDGKLPSGLFNVKLDDTTASPIVLSEPVNEINTIYISGASEKTVALAEDEVLHFSPIGGVLIAAGSGRTSFGDTAGVGVLTSGDSTTDGEIIVNASATVDVYASILDNENTVSLTKAGSGTMTLRGEFGYSGSTYVAGGVLSLFNGPALFLADFIVNNGTLNLINFNTEFARPFTHAAGTINFTNSTINASAGWLIKAGTANLYNTPLTVDEAFEIQSGTIVQSGNTSIKANCPVIIKGGTVSGGSITNTTGEDYQVQGGTISSALRGENGLVKMGGGNATLSGANSYTGDTCIRQGSVTFSSSSTSVRNRLIIGSADASTTATVSCTTTPLADTIEVTIYTNSTLSYVDKAQHFNNYLKLYGGTLDGGSQVYMDGNLRVEMSAGTLKGTFYGTANFSMTTLPNALPSSVTASLRDHSYTFAVADGAAAHDLIFGGSFTGNSQVYTKTGTGTMRITSTIGSSATFNLNEGRLLVDTQSYSGLPNGALNVATKAVLGGNGFISGAVAKTILKNGVDITDYASIEPGSVDGVTSEHIIGTLTVGKADQESSVTFGNYAKLKIRMDENGNCDKLVVYGDVTLSETAQLEIEYTGSVDALKKIPAHSVPILEVNGDILGAGAFASANIINPIPNTRVVKTANGYEFQTYEWRTRLLVY